jgi:hypothetical protein
VGGLAQDNSLGLAIGSVAVGFLVGLLLPATRVEDERFGGVADEVKETAKDLGQEALDRGKQVRGPGDCEGRGRRRGRR